MVAEKTQAPPVRVAVVGPCSAGKTTLVTALRMAGYDARHVAQEHSYVPYMWQRISKPDVLIFLDVDYDAFYQRRPHLGGGPARLAEQQRRLTHARQHCDFYLDTSNVPPEEVRRQVLSFLQELTIPG